MSTKASKPATLSLPTVGTCDSPGCGVLNAQNQCARCHRAYYCSVECQSRAWSSHRDVCEDFEALKKQRSNLVQHIDFPSEEETCLGCKSNTLHTPILLPCGHFSCFPCWDASIKPAPKWNGQSSRTCGQCGKDNDSTSLGKSFRSTLQFVRNLMNDQRLSKSAQRSIARSGVMLVDVFLNSSQGQLRSSIFVYRRVKAEFLLDMKDASRAWDEIMLALSSRSDLLVQQLEMWLSKGLCLSER